MIRQFTVELGNKPGELEKMVRCVSGADVDIRALEVNERGDGETGICHFIAADVEKAEKALRAAGYGFEITDVVVVAMEDKVGGLVQVLDALGKGSVNIKYLYAFVTQVAGRSLAVLGVDQPRQVAELLQSKGMGIVSQACMEKGRKGSEEVERVKTLDYYLGGTYFW